MLACIFSTYRKKSGPPSGVEIGHPVEDMDDDPFRKRTKFLSFEFLIWSNVLM
jgi:hypothetical protein